MQFLEDWLRQLGVERPARLLGMASFALLALALIACACFVMAGTTVGTLLANRAEATAEAARQLTLSAEADLLTTALPLEATPASATPQPTYTLEPTGTAEPTGATLPTPAPPPTNALGLPGLPVPAATLTPAELSQLLERFGPAASLELTPTSQLTLSSVILVQNMGQFAANVRFEVRGAMGGGVWLASDAIWVTLLEPIAGELGGSGEPAATASLSQTAESQAQSGVARGVSLRLSFVGANPSPQLVPIERLDTIVSYFRGSDPTGWLTRVPVWGGVRYLELYPGVDLELASEQGQYVQRLLVHPGADLTAVRLRVEGAQAFAVEPIPTAAEGSETGEELDNSGGKPSELSAAGYRLRLTTGLGDLWWPLFQLVAIDGSSLPLSTPSLPRLAEGDTVVEAPFFLADGTEGESSEGSSALLYSTPLGQGGIVGTHAIAVDRAGNAHVTGYAYLPSSFAAPGSFEASADASYDAFAIKLNASGTELAYAAFVGGSGAETGRAIAVDSIGRAYVAGITDSPDLPATLGAFDASYNGGYDTFVLQMNPSGGELGYVTYLGGSGHDRCRALAVDGTGSAYLTGDTESPDFPVTQGAWDMRSDGHDAFVVRLNPAGTGLAYTSTPRSRQR